nr:hypothetical protein [Enterobacter roggenkampii]
MKFDANYLGFLENIEENIDVSALDGPDGKPLTFQWRVWKNPIRFRLCAISRENFSELDKKIPAIQGVASARDRARRLAQLQESLRPSNLPLVDIHLADWIPLTASITPIAHLGGWYRFSVREERDGALMAPVFFTNPDDDDQTVRRAYLEVFEPAPEALAVRLRDIFSLSHVGDWGPDDGPEGTPENPSPPPPGDLSLTIIRIPATAKADAEATQAETERSYQDTQSDKPQDQRIKAGE